MQIPKEARRKARSLFDSSLDSTGRPNSETSLRIVDLLVKSSPRHTLQILREFTRLVRLELNKHHAVVESAVPIDESTRTAILKSLEKRDGGSVTLETKVDPSLIGGSRIRLGSEVWDSTLVSRLNALAS
jgi:F-type H+-transporting ATPase subunit delta